MPSGQLHAPGLAARDDLRGYRCGERSFDKWGATYQARAKIACGRARIALGNEENLWAPNGIGPMKEWP